MTIPRALVLVALVAGLPITHARAQTAQDSAAAVRVGLRRTDDPSLARGLLSALSGVALEAGVEGSKARARLARNDGVQSFALALETPFQERSGAGAPLTLDGLASDLTLSASYTRYLLPALTPRNVREYVASQERICARLGLPGGECNDQRVREVGGRAAQDDFLAATFGAPSIWVGSFDGTVGQRGVAYLTSGGDVVKGHRASAATTLSVGRLTPRALYYAEARYELSIDEQDEVTRCAPVSGQPTLNRCEEFSFGAPERDNSFVGTVGVRAFVGAVAIEPSVTFAAAGEVFSFALPVYLVRDADDAFTAGVRVGWRSDEDFPSASVFIAKPFTLGL